MPDSPRERRQTPRRGVATVEAAFCLPLLVLLVFGSIQTCDTVHLQHVATLAAYEGTLAASKVDASRVDVVRRAEGLLAAMGVSGATVSISPEVAQLSELPRGARVTVTVAAPVGSNLTGPAFLTPITEVVAQGVTLR